jgi:hypothetical protein
MGWSAQELYDGIYEDDDARVCADIPDAACSDVPANFFLIAITLSLTKLGDALANTKTTLPWLLTSLGAPGWIAAILVPVRESGSMLPQLLIANVLRALPIRKWAYVIGCFLQGLAMVGIAGSAFWLEGLAAGLAILAAVVAFSLARGLCSVASKDVLGKTVPKKRRGRASGLASSVAGFGTLIFAGALFFGFGGESDYLLLIAVAALLWFVAAGTYSRIKEAPGATEGGRNGFAEALKKLGLLAADVEFRNFVIARSLLVGTALTAPFLVVLAQSRADTQLPLFLLAQGGAALVSGHIWGVFADRSSRKVMLATAIAAGVFGLLVAFADIQFASLTAHALFFPVAFFVLAIIHDGVRLGRKTYVVDLAGGNKRTDYVAVSNAVLGVVLLAIGGIAAVLESFGTTFAIGALSLFAFTAAWFVFQLPEVQDD